MKPTVALVYDKVNTRYGGAELVLQALQQAFPNAPLYTSVHNAKQANWINANLVKPSFLQKIPGLSTKHQVLAPLMPIAFESHDLTTYDIVISVTSGEAKGVLTKPEQLHISYLLTPSRYLYSHQNEYVTTFPFFRLPGIQQLSKLLLRYLHWWDQTAIHRPDHIIAISNLVSNRIESYYHRQPTEVLYPPTPEPAANIVPLAVPFSEYFLSISRLVPYKRVDLSIQACLQTKQTLLVVGNGVEAARLHKLAGNYGYLRQPDESVEHALEASFNMQKKIVFLGSVTKAEASALIAQSQAVIMPGVEDYGITALEAASYGVPTLLHQSSGAAEVLGKNAVITEDETVRAIVTALRSMRQLKTSKNQLKKCARRHQTTAFTSQFQKIVYDLFIQHQQKGPHVYL